MYGNNTFTLVLINDYRSLEITWRGINRIASGETDAVAAALRCSIDPFVDTGNRSVSLPLMTLVSTTAVELWVSSIDRFRISC